MYYVDTELCSGCGLCLEVCPVGAITMQGRVASIDPDTCTACGLCTETCATDAILVLEMVPADTYATTAVGRQPTAPVGTTSPLSGSVPAATSGLPRPEARPVAGPAPQQPATWTAAPLLRRLFSGLVGLAISALDQDRGRGQGTGLWPSLRPGRAAPAARGAGGVGRRVRRSPRAASGCPGQGRGRGVRGGGRQVRRRNRFT